MKQLDYISSLHTSINRDTALLEACGWDENLAHSLLLLVESKLNILKEDPQMIKSYDDFETLLSQSLLEKIEEEQVTVLMNILREYLSDNFTFTESDN